MLIGEGQKERNMNRWRPNTTETTGKRVRGRPIGTTLSGKNYPKRGGKRRKRPQI